MATYSKVDAFVEDLANKQHDLGSDTLALFLTNTAHQAAWGNISDLSAATPDNISNKNLTVTSSSQTGGTYSLVVADKTMTSAGGATGPFQYVYIYNTVGGRLIGYYDFTSEQTVQDGQNFIVDFTDASQRLFTLT